MKKSWNDRMRGSLSKAEREEYARLTSGAGQLRFSFQGVDVLSDRFEVEECRSRKRVRKREKVQGRSKDGLEGNL